MEKKLLPAIAIFLVFLVTTGAAAMPTPFIDPEDESNKQPITVSALRVNYDRKENFIEASGDVQMVQGERTLKADYMKVDLATMDAVAQGNVLLYEGQDVLACDAFSINLNSQLGEVQSAKLFMKSENFHIAGTEIKKLGPDTYQVKGGIITTCDGENPLWRIDAKKIDVTIEGYGKVRDSTFRIKGVPVFYIPYFILPVKTERQSGLLIPEFGFSDRSGFEFNNSFFWAISPNTDATFYLDTATRKGVGEGLEYRFVLKEDSWGKFYGYFTKEEDRFFDHAYRNVKDRDHQRSILLFEGAHYFAPDFYVKAHGSHISDREFYEDYGTEVRRSKNALEWPSLRSLEKDESFAFVTKNWDFSSLLVNVDLYKNLVQKDENTLQRLPQITFSSIRQPLGSGPIFLQWDAAYDYFWREEGLKGQRLDVFPKVSWPFNRGGWLKFHPELGLRGLAYFDLNKSMGFDKEQFYPDVRAELSTTFLRIFTYSGKSIKKLKHTIEPRLEYTYVPDFDQEDFPDFDIPDRFFKRHSITYSVINRFTGLMLNKAGQLFERELGYFQLGQSFHFSRPRGGLYLGGNPDDDLSDLFAEVRCNIFSSFYLKTKAGYDPNNSDLSFYNTLLSWQNMQDEFIELEYRYERNKLEILEAEGKFKLTNSLYAFFDTRYNSLDNRSLDNELGFDYRAQCWGAKFFFETRAGTGGRRSDNRFEVVFYLRGLGETRSR